MMMIDKASACGEASVYPPPELYLLSVICLEIFGAGYAAACSETADDANRDYGK